MCISRSLFSVILLCSLAWADHQDWIDPLDPLSHDPNKIERDYTKYLESKQRQEQVSAGTKVKDVKVVDDAGEMDDSSLDMKLMSSKLMSSCSAERKQIDELNKELQKRPVDQLPYYKQFITKLTMKIQKAKVGMFADKSMFRIHVSLSDGDIDTLEDFTQSGQLADIRAPHAVLEHMIYRIEQIDVPPDAVTDWLGWFKFVLLVLTAFSSSVIAMQLQWRCNIPWPRLLGSSFVILFLISIPWNWWHLYQTLVADRMSKSQMVVPIECRPQDMDLFQYILSGLSIKDECKEFHRSLHVDSWAEIPPTKAIAVTVTKFVVEPLEHLGQALGKMVKATIVDLPVQLWPVALVFMLVVFVLLLIMGFGYKIRVFYIFGLEPNAPAIQGGADARMIQQLQAQIEAIQAETSRVHAIVREDRGLLQGLEEQLSRPLPLALPSIQPGEDLYRGSPYPMTASYPPSASTPYTSDTTLHRPGPNRISKNQGTPSRVGFVLPPPMYDTVVTPDADNEDYVEDISVKSVTSPNVSVRARKKKQVLKSLSDSSIAMQCSHTKEEDKHRRKNSREKSADEAEPSRDNTVDDSVEGDIIAGLATDNAVAGILRNLSTPIQKSIEMIGSQQINMNPELTEESSEDSDLEIIEDDPNNM